MHIPVLRSLPRHLKNAWCCSQWSQYFNHLLQQEQALILALSIVYNTLWTVSFLFFSEQKFCFTLSKKAILWLLGLTYSYIRFSSDADNFHSLLIFYPLCVPQKYEQELFKLALPCLSAVAGALPPDYMESNYVNMMEKQSSMDSDGNFNPQPVDTSK